MSIRSFVHSCDLFSSSWLSYACVNEHSIVCSFLWPFLSLPAVWVSLVTMNIRLFVHSCDPFSSSWLSKTFDDEHSMVFLFLRPLLFSLLFCLFLRPFVFCQFELGLREWTPNVFSFLLPSLIYLLRVRLVMMGTHCLFVLTTLSLLLGWVRLVTAGTQWVFILTTLSLLCFVKMSIHMFYLYKQFFDLCTSPCALFLYFQSTHPTVNACINKSQRWRCSTVCSTTVIFRFCMKFHFSSRTA